MFKLPMNKMLGLDGFPTSFYQHYWNVIKTNVLQFFSEFYYNNEDISRLNFSFTTLIPKKQKSMTIPDYRPVSLINGVTKILAKVIRIKLGNFMSKLVSKSQFAFIKV